MVRMILLLGAALVSGCGESKICDTCDVAAGLVWCTDCPTTESCVTSIEEQESGEVIVDCEAAIGEACLTDQLLATCPDF
jgi:hypothetical protein